MGSASFQGRDFIKMPLLATFLPAPRLPPLSSLSLFTSLQVPARLEIYDVFRFADTLRADWGDKEPRGSAGRACWLEKRVSGIMNTGYFAAYSTLQMPPRV